MSGLSPSILAGSRRLHSSLFPCCFDLLFRWLLASDYRVRYVRNITDVGHLENDADEGEDKISKRARIEQLEPMEIAQMYTRRYHDAMRALGVLPPSIEPTASGHIIEQIEMVRRILDAGYAYVSNGSVYFDVEKYARSHNYGELSGRSVDDMQSGSRSLDGQGDKRSPWDFALWKKAAPEHIMHWPSPWSEGFPGWHMECSAMSAKYLGDRFDIHGGGMDLVFPHHEAEIAQGVAACGHPAAKYWMHNNMVTIGGQKMGKSLGNSISLEQLFTGNHPLLTQAYSPMTIRFFMLQAHYRSTLDFSNEALQAAEKGLERLMKAVETLDNYELRITNYDGADNRFVDGLEARLAEAMDDDLGSPLAVAALFDAVRVVNQIHDGTLTVSAADLERLRGVFHRWVFEILGLRNEKAGAEDKYLDPVMNLMLELRKSAKEDKNWGLSDKIRDGLAAAGIKVMDKKDGTSEWQLQ